MTMYVPNISNKVSANVYALACLLGYVAFIQDHCTASSLRYITGQLVGKSDSYNKMRFCKQRKHGPGRIKNCRLCDLFILVHYANQLVQMILMYEMHLIANMNQLKWQHTLFHCSHSINQYQDGVKMLFLLLLLHLSRDDFIMQMTDSIAEL